MRIAFVAALIFGLPGISGAQENVLDRRIESAASGAAVVWVPDGIANGTFAWRVAQTAGVPLIFEASPLHYRDPAVAAERLDLAGHTVREALDDLVGHDPRYRWEERDGVIVIRPGEAWRNPEDPLNQRTVGLHGDELRAEHVLTGVMTIVSGSHTSSSLGVPATLGSKRFSLDVPEGTVLDVLVAAARSGGLMWSVPDAAWGPDQRGFSLGFKVLTGGDAGITGPASR
jgi:hypothetical protein